MGKAKDNHRTKVDMWVPQRGQLLARSTSVGRAGRNEHLSGKYGLADVLLPDAPVLDAEISAMEFGSKVPSFAIPDIL